jgi:O-antigen/teichoic acid export membrane protein
MTSELRTIGRHTAVYGVGIVASKLVSFIMLPIYTRYLTTADYGVLELIGTTIDVIGMLAGVSLAAGVFKHYAEIHDDLARRELMSTVTLATTGLALVVAILGFAASPSLTHLLFGVKVTALFFRLFFLIYFFQSVCALALMLIQVEERSRTFVTLNVAKLIVTLSLTIWLVVGRGLGIRGVLLGNLISTAAMSFGLGIYMFRRLGVHFSIERFRSLVRFGTPIAVWTVGSFILTFSDRYFLNQYSGPSAVGIYSLAYQFSFLLSALAAAPFSQIWEPRRFAIANQLDAPAIYRRAFLYLNLAMFIGSAAIVLFVRDVLEIMAAPSFLPAYRLVPLLLIVTIIQQWTGYCNLGLYLKNATNLYGWSAVIGVLTALTLNALLIPRYGMFGAAWATAAAYTVRFVPVYMFAQAKYHVDYPWSKVAALGAALAVIWGVRFFADGLNLTLSIALSFTLFIFLAWFIYSRILDIDEKAFVRQLIRRPFATAAASAA